MTELEWLHVFHTLESQRCSAEEHSRSVAMTSWETLTNNIILFNNIFLTLKIL